MNGWSQSVDRVLQLRRVRQLEQEKAELIEIVRGMEERCQLVVNRERFPVLKDVPSWRDGDQRPKMARVGGMRTWKDTQRHVEKKLSVETRKRERRLREVEQVMGGSSKNEEKHDG